MRISSLKLYNWKNFHECSVSLTERCFIVGANATGKSNFLDAIRFLKDIVKTGGGLQKAVDDRGGIKRIRCLAARRRTDVALEVTLSEGQQDKWRYMLSFKHSGGGILTNEVMVNYEKVFLIPENRYLLDRTGFSEEETKETLKYTHLEQAVTSKDFFDLKEALQNIQYLNIIPQLVRESNSDGGGYKDDYYGRNFLSDLAKLNEVTRNKYLRLINEVLRQAVPQLDNLTFVRDDKGFYHLEAKYQHWRAQGSRQTERQFSDGTLRLIGFLFAVLSAKGILLLEEPEINLHPGVVAQLPEFLAKLQRYKHRQLIITTHSYDILANDGIDEREVILLTNGNEGTLAENVSKVSDIRNVLGAGFSMADAVLPLSRPEHIQNLGLVEIEEGE